MSKVYFVSVDCWAKSEGMVPVQADTAEEATKTVLDQLDDQDWYRDVKIISVDESPPKPRLVVDNDKEKMN